MSLPLPDSSASPAPASRPFYKKKRYLIPAGLVALVLAVPGGGDDTVDINQASASKGAPGMTSASGEDKAAADRAAADKAAADQAAADQAAADQAAADKAAADKAAADAAAAQQAAAEAQRVAAAEAARLEAERLAAAQQAALLAAPQPVAQAYYQNCDAVRAAGAAPIRPGDAGWQQKFDRDKDGVGCEN